MSYLTLMNLLEMHYIGEILHMFFEVNINVQNILHEENIDKRHVFLTEKISNEFCEETLNYQCYIFHHFAISFISKANMPLLLD